MTTRVLVPQSYYIYFLLREDPEAVKDPFPVPGDDGGYAWELRRGRERGRQVSLEEYIQQYDMYFAGIGTAGDNAADV